MSACIRVAEWSKVLQSTDVGVDLNPISDYLLVFLSFLFQGFEAREYTTQ